MVADSYDVVIVGAGADGPVLAWKLGMAGVSVLLLEAGAFHGNTVWPRPNEEPGGEESSDPGDLSGRLLDQQFTGREFEMIERFLFGPADHSRGFWLRNFPSDGGLIQCAGVGGTALHYLGNHPRAYPAAIDEQGHWPINYEDLIPYYQEVETFCDVAPAPITAVEQLFADGAASSGWKLLDGMNITQPGYRPQPNAIRQPDRQLHVDEDGPETFSWKDVSGDTLANRNIAGNSNPRGAPFREKAKRASNISFVPAALETGSVTIRPNAFVIDVITNSTLGDTPSITGVTFRDTWSGSTTSVDAEVVVLAAGAIETPRLWLNSGLPDNGWVGKGMTIHYPDGILGFWEADDLEDRIGKDTVDQHHGQNSAIRFDYPGLGMFQPITSAPGVSALLGFGASSSSFTFQNETSDAPWDSLGRLGGTDLKRMYAQYRRLLPIFILPDDRPQRQNGVSVSSAMKDEHGPIAQVRFEPSETDKYRRDRLAEIAADILRNAGASYIHRADTPPTGIHIHSTMAMGKVVDEGCEAYDVEGLFVGDHSALSNGLGGPNPTNTGQALAARTAEYIVDRYFS